MKKINIEKTIFYKIVICIFLSSYAYSQEVSKLPSSGWQTSMELFQDISCRNKMIAADSPITYEATFIVYSHRLREKFAKTVKIKGHDAGVVFFPWNFKYEDGSTIWMHDGKFSWNCIVEGELAAWGSFYIKY